MYPNTTATQKFDFGVFSIMYLSNKWLEHILHTWRTKFTIEEANQVLPSLPVVLSIKSNHHKINSSEACHSFNSITST